MRANVQRSNHNGEQVMQYFIAAFVVVQGILFLRSLYLMDKRVRDVERATLLMLGTLTVHDKEIGQLLKEGK